jgi:NAD(P)-dependent dehydrogenase (short-subunit alcohol dehydrogenase family)
MDLQLQGRTAVVTGGSKGIGLACAKRLAAEGCHVELVARNAELLAAAKAALAPHGTRVGTHAVDLRDSEAVKRLAGACADADILVNNAGDIPGGSIFDIDEAKWRHAWDLKVFGYVNMTREMLGHMKARGRGVVVNVIGMAGEKPSFDYICGATANAGLAAFTKGLGAKSVEFGVRVLGVHPPATRTDRIVSIVKTVAKNRLGDESRWEEVLNDGSFGRVIEPEQVADTVAFLASPCAGQLSGVMLNLGA